MQSRSEKRQQSRLRDCSGFTLIEALVAFTLLALITVALQGLVVSSVRGTTQADLRLRAEAVARTLMTGPLAVGKATSEIGNMGGFAWRIRYAPLDSAIPPVRDDGTPPDWLPLRMTIEVWSNPQAESELKVETVRLLKTTAP